MGKLVFSWWIISGLITFIILALKIHLFRKIYRRTQDPQHYHYNFFGKKVLHRTVATPLEIAFVFVSMPLFLLAGSYFVARIINFFLYQHL